MLRLASRGARVNAKRRGAIQAAVATGWRTPGPQIARCPPRPPAVAEHLGANAAALTARAQVRNAARRGGMARRRP